MNERRLTWFVALLVFLAAIAVYLTTQYRTVPFWDSGEFIAVSTILGIPHPPGTPFYVLLGRMFTLLPWATIAERVNFMSGLSAALAVMFTYLVGFKMIRMIQTRGRAAGDGPAPASDQWIAHLGAVVGALMIAFSDSFWENATEAEVYATMSFAQILVLWLGLRWWEEHEKKPTAMPLLLATYLMWLCVGLHLGVALMSVPLLGLVALLDRKVALVFLVPFLTSLLVTMGLERLAGGVLLLSVFTFLAYAWQKKLNGWVVAGAAAAAIAGVRVAFSDAAFTPGTALLSAAALLVPLTLLARRHREGRILALALALVVIGYSTHVYLPIRAAQHPAINEGDPSTWESLRDLLERKQYGEMNMFERRGRFVETQLNKEFWRYFRRQWPVIPSGDTNGPVFPIDEPWRGVIPLLLGVAGAAWQARRERISFVAQFLFVGTSTAGMILFLNFSDKEVRERDYFFQTGYHAFAVWIGLGAAWLVTWVRDSFGAGPARRAAGAAAAAAMLAMPVGLLWNLWFTHDRRENFVARDYAFNMLMPLAPNSYVFTNGDNDTFPLWYLQQVEGVRPDVRVVNLSLLNTDWYIRQLRDEEPKVPIALDDKTIKALGRGYVFDDQGRVIYTSQYMVQHIIDQSRAPDGGWVKQPYLAVTVPDHHGLDPYFSPEALVYRVNRDSLHSGVDVAATEKAIYETFRYRGLFTADGAWDSTVYKDENASTLSRNYAAAHLQLAFHHRRNGDLPRAITEMERVARMFPDYVEVQIPLAGFYLDQGDTAKALALYARLAATNPNDAEARYYHGVSRLYRGELDAGVRELEAAIRLDPNLSAAYLAAYTSLWEAGRREAALAFLERWVSTHPGDQQARELLETQRRVMGLPGAPATPGAPPVRAIR
jgi:Flp pilus assembly protein TadD